MSDGQIMEGIRNGDEAAMGEAMEKYSGLLWSVASAVLDGAAPVQEVEECVADVFIYLWLHPEKYDPDRAKLSSYLSVVARSKAVDRYRLIIRKREIPMEKILVKSLQYAEGKTADAETEKLRSCMEELAETEKELIIRRYYYEQKPAEIALALNAPKKQVENKLYHVRKKLKKMMETQEGVAGYGKI